MRLAPPTNRSSRLLWVDCTAAALAGALVLALNGWLGRLYALPLDLLHVLGAVSLVYAAYSFSLARRADRTVLQVEVLVYANAFWVVVCLGLALYFWARASVFGIAHLIVEAVFVGVLAVQEWGERVRLASGEA